jgi:REP element-mobilizing transposase RayT
MSRPIRIQFAGAMYHVTARGDHKRGIYADDNDHMVWDHMLGTTCDRFNFVVHAYCQMGNHFHLLVETVEPNLSSGMRHLNATYSAYFNRRHKLVGHVFQGRFKAILCQRETYLLELSRYIVLNPVRAKFVERPEQWWWSSHRALIGLSEPPDWLDTSLVLAHFGGNDRATVARYVEFVEQGRGKPSPLNAVRHQTVLGDEDFVARLRDGVALRDREVTRVQRRLSGLPLGDYFTLLPFDEAVVQAYRSTLYSMAEIADLCGVSTKSISRRVKASEQASRKGITSRVPTSNADCGSGLIEDP